MGEESLNPQDIFFQASQLGPDDRDVYLRKVCHENDELRREVEALLEAYEGAGSFLDSPIVDRIRKTVVHDGSTHDAESEDGVEMIADSEQLLELAELRFRIKYSYAKGGLGEVFVADDRQLNRLVAVKEIPKEHYKSVGRRRRFLREAELTAKLEHPGIVPVYGLGQHTDGRPFYAMRFIEGETLETAIEKFHQPNSEPGESSVTFRKLISRFLAVCQTMAYVHTQGIIHRDLKPANIMLGPFGETLIVDWGLAKLIHQEDDIHDEPSLHNDRKTWASQVGLTMGTPGFMSPEQASAKEVDARSDIYSLGATLYAILTGKPPIVGEMPEIVDAILTGEFPAPNQVQKDVPPDLNAICMKALATEKENRYETTVDLTNDLEHWLADEPVAAWREPTQAKTARWFRKHQRLAAVLVTLLTVTLVGGTVWRQKSVYDSQFRQMLLEREAILDIETIERQISELDAELESRSGTSALTSDLSAWKFRTAAIQNSLESARGLLTSNVESVTEQTQLRLSRAEGRIQEHQRLWELAKQIDETRSSALALGAGEQFNPAKINVGYESLFQKELHIQMASTPTVDIINAIRLHPLRHILISTVDHWANTSQLETSLKDSQKYLLPKLLEVGRGVDPGPWRDRFRRVEPWHNLTQLEDLANDLVVEDQSPQLIIGLAARIRTNGGDAQSLLRRALVVYPNDFWLLFELGSVAESYSERMGYLQAALTVRPDNQLIMNNLGYAQLASGLKQLSLETFRQARDQFPDSYLARMNLATAYGRNGDVDAAITEAEAACELRPDAPTAHAVRAQLLAQKGDREQAIAAYRKSLSLSSTAKHWERLAELLLRQQQPAEARKAINKALELDPDSAANHYVSGLIYEGEKNNSKAAEEYRESIRLSNQWPEAFNNLGKIEASRNNVDEAQRLFAKAVSLKPELAEAQTNLAITYQLQGKNELAIKEFKKAVAIAPDLLDANRALGNLLSGCGFYEESIGYLRKVYEQDPNDLGGAVLPLGISYLATAKYREAFRMFSDAIQKTPPNSPPNRQSRMFATMAARKRTLREKEVPQVNLAAAQKGIEERITDNSSLDHRPPTFGSRRESFEIRLEADKAYHFRLQLAGSAILRLESADTMVLAEQVGRDSVSILFTPERERDVRVVILSTDPEFRGKFRWQVELGDLIGLKDRNAQLRLEPGSSRATMRHRFKLRDGQRYLIEVDSREVIPRFVLEPLGPMKAQPSVVNEERPQSCRLDIESKADGHASVLISTGRPGLTGRYRFRVWRFQAAD